MTYYIMTKPKGKERWAVQCKTDNKNHALQERRYYLDHFPVGTQVMITRTPNSYPLRYTKQV